MSNETFWPSFRVRMPAASTAVACTNTSLPPPSGAMKPKPLVVLKNLTVPIVIHVFLHGFPPWRDAGAERGFTVLQGRKFNRRPGAHSKGGQDKSRCASL